MNQNRLLHALRLTTLGALATASIAGAQLANAADIPNKTLVYCSEGSPEIRVPGYRAIGAIREAHHRGRARRRYRFFQGGLPVVAGEWHPDSVWGHVDQSRR